MRKLKIVGTGASLPDRVLTNADLERMVETSDEWITTRTGIKERRIADDNTATSDLVIEAGKKALESAGMEPGDLDAIIVATVTPDMFYPSTASWVQKGLGTRKIPAFDLSAACSGFLYGLEVADGLVSTGVSKNILLAGAEVMSKVVNWEDRNTCVLFGDGAGVVIVSATEEDRGIYTSCWGADGAIGDLLMQPAGGTRMPPTHETIDKKLHTVHMKGNEVFKHAVRAMGDSAVGVLKEIGMTGDDVDLFIPHQANRRIIEATCKRAKISMEKTVVTIDKYGNVPAATIPIALDEVVRSGRLKRDDTLLLASFGGGFTWAAAVLKW
jgi:3-oxoacyl-[acyl-carrier-protein] synthase-3